jgi:peptidoglycan-associated lipoprotein
MKQIVKLAFLVLIVCAVAMTGCKKKPKSSGLSRGDNIGGLVDGGLGSEGLGSDRFGGTEVTGQFAPVYFDYDSAQVNQGERAKLDSVAAYLRSNGAANLVVEGHCDERGSNEYNLALGERRALAVRAYLVGLGIDAARIQTKSYGEEKPAALGHDEGSWAQNRRGEFGLIQ